MGQSDQYVTSSASETEELGKILSETLTKQCKLLLLFGDLGSGKTTFVQGLAQGLGISRRIISPTFILQRTYPVGNEVLYHIDLYRLEESETNTIGIGELLEQKNAVVLIEWPEKLGSNIPCKRTEIHFAYLTDTKRSISIQHYE